MSLKESEYCVLVLGASQVQKNSGFLPRDTCTA